MQQWLIDHGIQAATLVSLCVFIWKMSRWSGIQETRITNLEGWLKSHIEQHPGKSK